MALTRLEREKVTDSVLKIQSARASLHNMDPNKVPEFEQIENCLKSADENLKKALRRP